MTDKTKEQKAEELANSMSDSILKARQELAQKMTDEGKLPPKWSIQDNLEEFIDHPEVGYRCWEFLTASAVQPRFKRANT